MEAKPKRGKLTFLKARGHFWGINCSSKQEPCSATPRHNGGGLVVPPVCTDGKNLLMQVRGRHRRGQAGWRGGGSQQLPSSPPFWLVGGRGLQSYSAQRTFRPPVPFCSSLVCLPAQRVGVGGPELGARTEGTGNGNRDGGRGGAGPPTSRAAGLYNPLCGRLLLPS